MYTGKVTRRASDVCDEGHGDQRPAELYQAPQQAQAPSGRAKRFRTKACKRSGTLRHRGRSEKASDLEHLRREADLENTLRVYETLRRVQAAAHRDLLFVHDRIVKCQAGCECFKAQNQYLQQHILTLAALGMPADTDECSEASSADLLHAGQPCMHALSELDLS